MASYSSSSSLSTLTLAECVTFIESYVVDAPSLNANSTFGSSSCMQVTSVPLLLQLNVPTQNLPLDDSQKPHLASYSMSQLAELRAWQQTAYALACIDTTLSFISSAIEFDALTMQICEAMFATILSLPTPCTHPPPAKPQPDDKDRVTDRHLFYDEPLMQSLISSFDDESRQLLKGAAERERARLPLSPSAFTAS